MNSHTLRTTVSRRSAPRRRLPQPARRMRCFRSGASRTVQSARAWHRERMIGRHAARLAAGRTAAAAGSPAWSAAAEPVQMLVAPRTRRLNTRHVVPAPDAPHGRQDGMPWIV